MNRREQRETAFLLLFEREFQREDNVTDLFTSASVNREIDLDNMSYIKDVYFGIAREEEKIDNIISECSKGWKVERITKTSRSVLRLSVYEMLYLRKDIPLNVSVNEAVEITKKYDIDSKPFVNGILNAVLKGIEEGKIN